MKKNGSFFLSIVDRPSLKAGIWDPYCYRDKKQTQTLGYFAAIHSLKGTSHRDILSSLPRLSIVT